MITKIEKQVEHLEVEEERFADADEQPAQMSQEEFYLEDETTSQVSYNEEDIVIYKIDEYLEKEERLLNAKPVNQEKQNLEKEEDEVSIVHVLEEQEPLSSAESTKEYAKSPVIIDPDNHSIDDFLKSRAEERKQSFKRFNHKFSVRSSEMNHYEKEPAYKRMGVELKENIEAQPSRYTVGDDESSILRTNNSYLHDNVD